MTEEMFDAPDGKFRLTWNLPAKKQWFDADTSHIRISVRDGMVMFKATNKGGKDAIQVLDRTRGGVEGGKEAYVAGNNSEALLALLRSMGWTQGQPFFMLDKSPTSKDWFYIVSHHDYDKAPAKFHPHMRLWLPREAPRRVPDAVIDSEVTRLLGPLARILMEARTTVDDFENERRIGRPNRETKQANNVLRIFTNFVRRVLPDYKGGVPIEAVLEANRALMRALHEIDPNLPLMIESKAQLVLPPARKARAPRAEQPMLTIEGSAVRSETMPTKPQQQVPEPQAVPEPKVAKAKAPVAPAAKVTKPATVTKAKSVKAKASVAAAPEAPAVEAAPAQAPTAKARVVEAKTSKAPAKVRAATPAKPVAAKASAAKVKAAKSAKNKVSPEPAVADAVEPKAAAEVEPVQAQVAPAPEVAIQAAPEPEVAPPVKIASKSAPAASGIVTRRSKPVQTDLKLHSPEPPAKPVQQPVEAAASEQPKAQAAKSSTSRKAERSASVEPVEDDVPIRELTVEADPEFVMHDPDGLGVLPRAVTRRKGWKSQVDGSSEPRMRRAG